MSYSDSYLVLVIGVLTAIAYKNWQGIIPGGILVPGLLVIIFSQSLLWGTTLLLLSIPIYRLYIWLNCCLSLISNHRQAPMYGLAIISTSLVYGISFLYFSQGWLRLSFEGFLGGILPAVIAFNWFKQKDGVAVFKGLTTITGITGLSSILLSYSRSTSAFENTTFNEYLNITSTIDYPLFQLWLILGVGCFIYHYRNLRPGGYLLAPVAAILLLQPLSGLLFTAGVAAVCAAVYYLSYWSLTIGLNRYALTVLLSVLYVWGIELGFDSLRIESSPFQELHLPVILTMIGYSNDIVLYWGKDILSLIMIILIIAVGGNFLSIPLGNSFS